MIFSQETGRHPGSGKDEGEFPDLGKVEARLEGDPKGMTQETNREKAGGRLQQQNHGHSKKGSKGVLSEKIYIHQHPYRDEEEAAKTIPEGQDIGDGLKRIFGLGDNQSCEEGAQSQGEPES